MRAGLDRNDRYCLALSGAEGWARAMLTLMTPDDEPSWLLATEDTGAEVGVPSRSRDLRACDG